MKLALLRIAILISKAFKHQSALDRFILPLTIVNVKTSSLFYIPKT